VSRKHGAIHIDLRALATGMLAETLPDPTHKDTRSHARKLFDSSPFSASYFTRAERTVPELLKLLGEGEFAQAFQMWNKTLRHSAQTAWNQLLESLGASSRALRADARFLPRFYHMLNKHLPKQAT